MIRKAPRITALHFDLIQRVELTHQTCANIIADLRDATVQIWTGANPDGIPSRSAAGWVAHFQGERQRLLALRDTVAPIIQRVYPEMVTPIQDYMGDVPLIAQDIQTAIGRHSGRNEPLTTGERTQLANAIEARLEV